VQVVSLWNGSSAHALRIALRMTTEAYAEHLGVAARSVAKWEKEPDLVPQLSTQEVLDAALSRSSDEAKARFALLVEAADMERKPDHRRNGRSAATEEADTADDIAVSMFPSSVVGRASVAALRAVITDYWRRDDRHGSLVLLPAVLGHLQYARSLIPQATGDISRDLKGVTAELARLVGAMSLDARRFSTARNHFRLSLALAREIEDHDFVSNVLAGMSLLATYTEDPAEAVALAAAAQDTARDAATPRVMAMLAMREAFGQAALGDRQGCHVALSDSERWLERVSPGDTDPDWVRYFDETKFLVDSGIARARLGEYAEAEPLIAGALEREDSNNLRGRAFHLYWLARTQSRQGKIDEARATTSLAAQVANEIESPRVKGHVRELSAELDGDVS
jgi:tetratricopeptide (TPR) repeat protein